MKIRIFALAKELGLDSKDLIEHASAAGVEVKNSALASISPAEKALILSHMNKSKGGGVAVAPPRDEPAAPRREALADRNRQVRAIDTPVQRPIRPAPPEAKSPAPLPPGVTPAPAKLEVRPEPAVTKPTAGQPTAGPSAANQPPASKPHAVPPVAPERPKPPMLRPEMPRGGRVTPLRDLNAAPPKKPVVKEGGVGGSPKATPTVSQPPVAPATVPNKTTEPAKATEPGKAAEPAKTPVSSAQASKPGKPIEVAVQPVPGTPAVPTQKPGGPAAAAAQAGSPPADSGTPPVGREADGGKADGGSGRTIGVRPDDYVAAPGMQPRRGMRDMRPVGTVQTNAKGAAAKKEQGGDKKRPQLARPAVAPPPKFTPSRPKVEPNEAPAQKPDVPLTPGMLKDRASPLAGHLASRGSEKKGSPRRGGAAGGTAKDLLEEKEQEALKARRRTGRGRRGGRDDDDDSGGRRRTLNRNRKRGPVEYTASATVETPITIRSLSEAMGRPAKQLMTVLFKQGQMVTVNDLLDEELATEIAMELGVDLTIKRERDLELELEELLAPDEDESLLIDRAPVVTILGHVDHGKTTLLDKLRGADTAAGEAGGITQHIASYQVEHNGKTVTFVDTPGHAAFSQMRSRGANVTDVVVLVVAADDGVMPQTEESISHAKAAGVPMIVALNKIDVPGADVTRALQGLAAREVLPAEWGGDTEVIRTSGATGEGLEELLDTILITAELKEYKANPDRPAVGICLEGFRDEGRGPIAWVIVQNGTLAIGDVLLCGSAYGRVRAMYNDRDEEVDEVGPSTPVRVAGLESVPNSGSRFFVLDDIEDARELAQDRKRTGREEFLAETAHRPQTLDDILEAAKDGEIQDLPLILKADTPGSIEAIRYELAKIEHPEVRVRVIHTGVGGVNESDVSLASASGAVIVAFHVAPEDRAAQLADREGVDIRRYNIIYEVTDQIRQVLEGMLKPEQREVFTGRAIVLQTFKISRFGTIAGCRILNGTIERNNRVHLYRQQVLVNTFSIGSLRREKDDVREVREGMECGIRLDNFNDIKDGDILEAFRIEEVKRKLE